MLTFLEKTDDWDDFRDVTLSAYLLYNVFIDVTLILVLTIKLLLKIVNFCSFKNILNIFVCKKGLSEIALAILAKFLSS